MSFFRNSSAASPELASGPVPAARSPISLVQAPEAGLGPDAIAVPSEGVTLARVSLPLATQRQRLAAAGFAVEDMIAEPLEAVHVAVGPELASGEYLVAVLRRTAMDTWAAKTDMRRKRLVPDVLALPVPVPGSVSVREGRGRVLVRRADGTGFATRVDAFETFWRAEGAPQIVLFGGGLPEGLPVGASGLMPAVATPEAMAFDLMQGPWAPGHGKGRKMALRLAAILGVTLAVHVGILGAKMIATQRIAAERVASLRAELVSRVPGLPADADLDVALRRALPSAHDTDGAGFMPLLSRISVAMLSAVGPVSIRNMQFIAAEGSLAILVEAPDLATLQGVENSLLAAGLMVEPGVATTGNGLAEVRYVIAAADG